MSATALAFADGTAFFIGLALAGAGLPLLLLGDRLRALRPLVTVAVLAGAPVAVLSSAPLPRPLLAAWGIAMALAVALAAFRPRGGALRRTRAIAVILAAALSAVLAAAELPHRRAPAIAVLPGSPVHVIGDSISAGIREGERPWPAVLGDLFGLTVINHARPAATVESARSQAEAIPDGRGLIIVEIGGNDVLGGTSPEAFRRQLDGLLAEVRRKGSKVAMMELPLPPLQDEFGRAQRALAREHGVTLIPKRILSGVFALEGGTIDGLHLSPKGHEALARAVAELISLESPEEPPGGPEVR